LVLQKQPGTISSTTYGKINIPDAWKAIWTYGSSDLVVDGPEYKTENLKDNALGLIFTDKSYHE